MIPPCCSGACTMMLRRMHDDVTSSSAAAHHRFDHAAAVVATRSSSLHISRRAAGGHAPGGNTLRACKAPNGARFEERETRRANPSMQSARAPIHQSQGRAHAAPRTTPVDTVTATLDPAAVCWQRENLRRTSELCWVEEEAFAGVEHRARHFCWCVEPPGFHRRPSAGHATERGSLQALFLERGSLSKTGCASCQRPVHFTTTTNRAPARASIQRLQQQYSGAEPPRPKGRAPAQGAGNIIQMRETEHATSRRKGVMSEP